MLTTFFLTATAAFTGIQPWKKENRRQKKDDKEAKGKKKYISEKFVSNLGSVKKSMVSRLSRGFLRSIYFNVFMELGFFSSSSSLFSIWIVVFPFAVTFLAFSLSLFFFCFWSCQICTDYVFSLNLGSFTEENKVGHYISWFVSNNYMRLLARFSMLVR